MVKLGMLWHTLLMNHIDEESSVFASEHRVGSIWRPKFAHTFPIPYSQVRLRLI